MDEQPGQQAAPHYSPDGKWWWNGSKWVAVAEKPKSGGAKSDGETRAPGLYRWDGQTFRSAPSIKVIVAGVATIAVVALLVGIGIGRAGTEPAPTTAATAATPTTDVTTPIPLPTSTPIPTPVPTPTPLAFSGTGSKVVGFDAPRGLYKLAWQAQGQHNFIVRLEGDQTTHLVNEILPNPSSGETTVRLGGGHYALNVETSTASWSITLTQL